MIPGVGTAVNVATVLVGSTIGVLLGNRLPVRTRDVVTDALGLITLLIGALSATAVTDPALVEAVGASAPVLIVLGALLIGGIAGSLLRVESRVESWGGRLQARFSAGSGSVERHRFVEGFVTTSILYCVGPLAILGPLNEGLGRGSEQLYLKAVLDGFASIAFAASFGWGVAASALSLLAVQGSLTVIGVLLGGVLPDAQVAALSATGGLLLIGIGLRLLRIREIPVADLLPALVVAPVLVQTAALWH